MTRPYNNQQKISCRIVYFAVLGDHIENEKKDKYLDLGKELKNLWIIKVAISPIVIGALGTVTKGLLKGLAHMEISKRVETIQVSSSL